MNKTDGIKEIEKILRKHNEWDVFDDEIDDGYGTIEYHKESIDKVVKELADLIQSREKKAVEEFVEYLDANLGDYINFDNGQNCLIEKAFFLKGLQREANRFLTEQKGKE